MNDKTLFAYYEDENVLLDAVKKIRENQYSIAEVYTPFPVHGLDKAMGLSETRMAITSFLYGCVGISFAIWLLNYIMIEDWPQNMGGKPSFSFLDNLPAFVPVLFELTVFFAAHLMVITFYLRSKLWPMKKPENPCHSTTDNRFAIALPEPKNIVELKKLIKQTGAIAVEPHKLNNTE